MFTLKSSALHFRLVNRLFSCKFNCDRSYRTFKRMGSQFSMDKTDALDYVNKTVKKDCIVIFSKTNCSFCSMAKRIFDEIGVNYKAIELNDRLDESAIQDALLSLTGERTVPRVFIGGKFVGGGNDMKNLHATGQLFSVLKTRCPASTSKQFYHHAKY